MIEIKVDGHTIFETNTPKDVAIVRAENVLLRSQLQDALNAAHPSEDARNAALKKAKVALTNLTDAYHEGAAVAITPASDGYVDGLVQNAEDAILAIDAAMQAQAANNPLAQNFVESHPALLARNGGAK